MSSTEAPERAPVDDPPQRSLWREVLTVFAASLVLIHAAMFAQRLLPLLGPYLYVFVALVFIAVPTYAVSKWRGADPIAAGMRFGSLSRGLAWGLGATALTVPLFVLGFHVWHHHVLGQEASPSLENYIHWEERLEGRPGDLDRSDPEALLHVWARRDRLHLWWPATNPPPPLMLDADAIALLSRSNARVEARGARWLITPVPQREGHLSLKRTAAHPGEVTLQPASPGEVPALTGGAMTQETLPLSLSFGYGWLLAVVLTQLFFVALPEEYFYRGYVQPTLARHAEQRRWSQKTVLGVGYTIILTSVFFALGHVFVEWHWQRLMVFFPSIAFGWLRDRSEGLTAPLIYHAACNLMVELTAVHYNAP